MSDAFKPFEAEGLTFDGSPFRIGEQLATALLHPSVQRMRSIGGEEATRQLLLGMLANVAAVLICNSGTKVASEALQQMAATADRAPTRAPRTH